MNYEYNTKILLFIKSLSGLYEGNQSTNNRNFIDLLDKHCFDLKLVHEKMKL